MNKRWVSAIAVFAIAVSGACVVETDMVPRVAEAACFGSDEPPLPGDTPGSPPGGDSQADDACAEIAVDQAGDTPATDWTCAASGVCTTSKRGTRWSATGKAAARDVAEGRARASFDETCRALDEGTGSPQLTRLTCWQGVTPPTPENAAPSSDELKDRTCRTVGDCVVGTDISPHAHTGTWPHTTESDARFQNERAFYASCSGAAVIAETECGELGSAAKWSCTGDVICETNDNKEPPLNTGCTWTNKIVDASSELGAMDKVTELCAQEVVRRTPRGWYCGVLSGQMKCVTGGAMPNTEVAPTLSPVEPAKKTLFFCASRGVCTVKGTPEPVEAAGYLRAQSQSTVRARNMWVNRQRDACTDRGGSKYTSTEVVCENRGDW